MVKRRTLKPEQAKLLGLKVKPNYKGKNSAQYKITDDQWNSVRGITEKQVLKAETKTETSPNDYPNREKFIMSAWNYETGQNMDIDEYCERYNLPRKDVTSWKFISHTGTPHYNIVFKENLEGDNIDLDLIKEVLVRELKGSYTPKINKTFNKDKEACLKWADLHFGAYIRNLLLTKDFDSYILLDGLLKSVEETNQFGFKKVHVHINGDLIESFSGLNHINSWMSMNPEEIGAKAIRLCVELLHKVLSKIDNLGEIKIVAGNHDRTSKANDEDVKGGAAELIAWGLDLMGYNVEFHPYITRQLIDGINHINLHGDKGISKRSTKDIIWDYGTKGVFNFVFEAHLHSLIEKMSVTQREKFKVVRDDAIDHRRMHLQSFTGNYYSETLNFNSNAGYCIVWNNGGGLPQVFNGCVHNLKK